MYYYTKALEFVNLFYLLFRSHRNLILLDNVYSVSSVQWISVGSVLKEGGSGWFSVRLKSYEFSFYLVGRTFISKVIQISGYYNVRIYQTRQ